MRVAPTTGNVGGSREIERLLKTHGIDFRLSAGNKRLSFDLKQPIVVMKHRDIRVTAVCARDAELAAVEPADPVLDVELDHAPFRHLLDRIAHQSVFLDLIAGFGNLRDRQHEYAGLLRGRVDMGVEGAAVGSL